MMHRFDIKNGELGKYRGSEINVVVPEGVTKIGNRAFINCDKMTSITLPNSLKEIGEEAFCYCKSLTSVIIPDGVTRIDAWAFDCCTNLTSIVIPTSLSHIGYQAFGTCTSLQSIVIPESVTEIGNGAFNTCTNLTTVTILGSMTTILPEAFYGCPQLTVICREDSKAHEYCRSNYLSYIFDYQFKAFRGILPPGIERLASPFRADEESPYVFVSYSHKDREPVLRILKDLYESGWRIWYDEGLTIGDRYDETLESHVKHCAAFLLFVSKNSLNSNYINKYEIPWAEAYNKPVIKCVLDGGIDYNINISKLVATVPSVSVDQALNSIPDLVKGERREAKGISVVFNPSYRKEKICERYAYCLYSKKAQVIAKSILLEAKDNGCIIYDAVEHGYDEEKLKNCACLIVFIDKAFISDAQLVGMLAKEYGTGRDIGICQLEEIKQSDLPIIIRGLFDVHWLVFDTHVLTDNKKQLPRFLEKRGCVNTTSIPGFIYEHDLFNGIVIERYTGKEFVPRIENEYGGVPVVEIADGAFENCKHIRGIKIPDYVKKIGAHAFEGCTNLTAITIPEGVTEIGNQAFEKCSHLTSLVIPDTVTEIKPFMCAYCPELTSVSISKNVHTISRYAFFNCVCLTSIMISSSVKTIEKSAFENCQNLESIFIPCGVEKIEESVFEGCSNLTQITIPDGIKKIEYNTFTNCKKLKSIIIPDSVTEIEDFAFSHCTGLISVTLSGSPQKIGWNAFYRCQNLSIHGEPRSYAKWYAFIRRIRFVNIK